jgi:TRAP-type C4-dicarboxylate transport system permease small subunit
MVLFIFSQVIARFVLNTPLSWTEELSRHIMIWMAFLSTAVAYRHGAHLSIDIISTHIKPNARMILKLVFLAIIITFLIYMLIFGIELTQRTYRQTSSSLQYPMSYIYLSIPSSAILMIIFSIEKIIYTIKAREEESR